MTASCPSAEAGSLGRERKGEEKEESRRQRERGRERTGEENVEAEMEERGGREGEMGGRVKGRGDKN